MVKDDVLRALEAARGERISGGQLAARLGVSRTAVWKAVDSLRETLCREDGTWIVDYVRIRIKAVKV